MRSTAARADMRNNANMRKARPSVKSGAAYINGTSVRKLRPVEEPETVTHRRPARLTRREKKEIKREELRIARNREKALAMDIPYLFMLTAAVLATLYICYSYLCLQSSISTHMTEVERLETRLETLKNENDALESSINTSVDLNYVYNVAINELGMVHAGKDSIINFDKTESEYVRQYEEIPQ